MQFIKTLKQSWMLLAGIVMLSLMLCTGATAETKTQAGKSLVIRTNKPASAQVDVQTVGQLQLAVTPNKANSELLT